MVRRQTKAEIRVTLYEGGVPADAIGTPTVTITRDSDGSAVVTGAATTKVPSTTGIYAYTLTPTQTATLDLLTAQWSAILGGVTQVFTTQVEIVGGFLVSLEAIAAASGGAATTAELSEARDWAEEVLEESCSTAFRPRYAKERVYGSGNAFLLLNNRRPLAVRSVSVDGTVFTAAELSDLTLGSNGVLRRSSAWDTAGTDLVYEYGYTTPPVPVQRAALKLAAYFLTEDPSDYFDRATSLSTDDGASYSLVTPGVRGAVTSIPEVNQVIEAYSPSVGVG